MEITKRQWHADTFKDPQVDQTFSGDLPCNKGDLFVCGSARFITLSGKELTICRWKEDNVEAASAWIKEAERRSRASSGGP